VFMRVCAFRSTLPRCVLQGDPLPKAFCPPVWQMGFSSAFSGFPDELWTVVRGATNQALLEHTTGDGRTIYIL
jgi:hypothetical protein